jgi:hypothetical protein
MHDSRPYNNRPDHSFLRWLNVPNNPLHRWFRCVSVLILTTCSTLAHAQIEHIEKPSLQNVVRDAAGRIWANAPYDNHKILYIWKNDRWIPANFSAGEGFFPIVLAKRPDGTIVCLWRSEAPSARQNDGQPNTSEQSPNGQNSDGQNSPSPTPTPQAMSHTINQNLKDYKVSEHRGNNSRLIASFTAEMEWSPVFLATSRDLWITRGNKEIYRIGPDHSYRRVYMVADRYIYRSSNYKTAPLLNEINPLRALSDGMGRVWFFADSWTNGGNSYSMRGALIWDGQHFTHLTSLKGVPGNRPTTFSTIAYKDSRHLWMVLGEEDLYEFDIASMQARRVAPPYPKAFHGAHQITAVGKDWYLVAGSRWGSMTQFDETMRTSSLWRLREGKWRLLISGLDKSGADLWEGPQAEPRPLLPTPQGLWVGAFGGGAWFVPRTTIGDGKPIAIDWRRGFRLETVKQLYSLGSDRVLAYGGAQGSAVISDVHPLLTAKATPRVRVFRTLYELVQDRRGHLWGALSLKANALNEWNGERWLRHPVPQSYHLSEAWEYALDKRGRVWILPFYRSAQTAIFDPERNSWQVFATYQRALQAQRRKAGERIRAETRPEFERIHNSTHRSPFQIPDFSRDGRICYRSSGTLLHYFDGKRWRLWNRFEITKAAPSPDTYFDGPPFFDPSGTLSVNIDYSTWKRSEDSGWQKLKKQEGDPRPDARIIYPTDAASAPETSFSRSRENLQPRSPDSKIRDEKGVIWVLWQKQLYKTLPGMEAPQFSSKENHPFTNGRSFYQVFVDNRGNRFFLTRYGYREYVMLPHEAPPETKVQITQNSIDSFTFDFSIAGKGAKWFQWRLDKEPWSQRQTASRVRLDAVPGGKHEMEVAATGRSLLRDPSPAVVAFTVNIDPAKQVAGFITDLASRDYARREAAIAGLAKQPERALPALNSARGTAGEDTQWWINAAIQQIETEAARRKASSSENDPLTVDPNDNPGSIRGTDSNIGF